MERGNERSEEVEKMGFETPYRITVHCGVCWAVMFVGPMDFGKACPDCNPDQWGREDLSS